MTAQTTAPAPTLDRGGLITGVVAALAGAVVVPYGAGMPNVAAATPGPGLFPMLIGGMLVLFGLLQVLTTVLAHRRARRLEAELTAIREGVAESPSEEAAALAAAEAEAAEAEQPEAAPSHGDPEASAPEQAEAATVVSTDIGSEGIRRWINGAIVLGGIVGYMVLAPVLGFPITMFLLITAIVRSLRASWAKSVITGVVAAIGLWALFEQGLYVQLPDGFIEGF